MTEAIASEGEPFLTESQMLWRRQCPLEGTVRIIASSLVAVLVVIAAVAQQQTTGSANTQSAGDKTVGKSIKSVGAVDVLSDTMGVDFGPYLVRAQESIRQNWLRVIPDSARAPEMKKGRVTIEFAIMKDGQVAGLQIVGTSGDVALDRAAYRGITASKPFLPLPSEFGGKYLALRFHFYYNPDRHEPAKLYVPAARITISPASADIASGTTQQFSATVITLTGNVNTPVNWSVVGPGCKGTACGTISTTGLYSTPTRVPNPPTVRVIGTLAADPSQTASAIINIGSGNPPH
jgi:TonB family protein